MSRQFRFTEGGGSRETTEPVETGEVKATPAEKEIPTPAEKAPTGGEDVNEEISSIDGKEKVTFPSLDGLTEREKQDLENISKGGLGNPELYPDDIEDHELGELPELPKKNLPYDLPPSEEEPDNSCGGLDNESNFNDEEGDCE